MGKFELLKGALKTHLKYLYSLCVRLYGLYERFIIMYTPFISSVLYSINIFLFKEEMAENSDLYFYNGEISGHSLIWLQLALTRSKSMCKWYKGAILLSMFCHVINIMYYNGLVEFSYFTSLTFSIAIISIIFWLIFRITYKTTKAIHSACKH